MKRLKKLFFRSKDYSLYFSAPALTFCCSETFAAKAASTSFDLTGIPSYTKDPYVVL